VPDDAVKKAKNAAVEINATTPNRTDFQAMALLVALNSSRGGLQRAYANKDVQAMLTTESINVIPTSMGLVMVTGHDVSPLSLVTKAPDFSRGRPMVKIGSKARARITVCRNHQVAFTTRSTCPGCTIDALLSSIRYRRKLVSWYPVDRPNFAVTQAVSEVSTSTSATKKEIGPMASSGSQFSNVMLVCNDLAFCAVGDEDELTFWRLRWRRCRPPKSAHVMEKTTAMVY
jgi:hypothetical protein